ncbi:hypothetical protein [Streptomyces sp. CA-132043]|uniref:hypothetical protein n=1 Tax=Streptomyces sp. CA-132043 TaxID=3240048 RepID=UPI003D94C03D
MRALDGPDRTPAAPVDYQLALPEGWFRIPLEVTARQASVEALVDRQFKGVDDAPHLKRQAREDLLARAVEAERNGGVELYISLQQAGPTTIPASLLVTLATPPRPGGVSVTELANYLQENGPQGQQVATGKLPAGSAVRVRQRTVPEENDPSGNSLPTTTLDYYVQIPESDAYLLLTFSTPLDPIADALVELFDAVAGSLAWIGTNTDGGAES